MRNAFTALTGMVQKGLISAKPDLFAPQIQFI
jgi:hypothetical protein